MKGLLYKDLISIVSSYKKNASLVLVIYTVCAVAGDMPALLYAIIFLMGMYAVSTLSFDEYSHWDMYGHTLPVTPRQAVAAKYLLGLGFMGTGTLLAMLLLTVTSAFRGQLASSVTAEHLAGCLSALATVLLYYAIAFPLSFKMGATKARTAVLGVMCALAMVCFLAWRFAQNTQTGAVVGQLFAGMSDRQGVLLLFGVFAVSLMIYIVSWQISAGIYDRKEF